ncbi:MAG: hypothetical protein ACK4V5_13740 [Cyanobium sp.]|jgi:hypothetical protein
MTHPLEPSPAAAGSPVLPLQLLQPLDATHPFSTPASSGGPHQRLIVSPDPAAGAELDLRPTRLLISKEGQIRSIWPVHLAGWQQLGWQLHAPVETPAEGQELEDDGPPASEPQVHQPPASQSPSPAVPPAPVAPVLAAVPAVAGEAVLSGEVPNFQAMTKAEITAFCASTYGVSLDGAMTKAELVATATGLLQQSPPQEAEAQGAEPQEDDPKGDVPPEGATPADQAPDADRAAGGDDLGFQGDGADPEFPDDLL